jgi:hypothetical protein
MKLSDRLVELDPFAANPIEQLDLLLMQLGSEVIFQCADLAQNMLDFLIHINSAEAKKLHV